MSVLSEKCLGYCQTKLLCITPLLQLSVSFIALFVLKMYCLFWMRKPTNKIFFTKREKLFKIGVLIHVGVHKYTSMTVHIQAVENRWKQWGQDYSGVQVCTCMYSAVLRFLNTLWYAQLHIWLNFLKGVHRWRQLYGSECTGEHT